MVQVHLVYQQSLGFLVGPAEMQNIRSGSTCLFPKIGSSAYQIWTKLLTGGPSLPASPGSPLSPRAPCKTRGNILRSVPFFALKVHPSKANEVWAHKPWLYSPEHLVHLSRLLGQGLPVAPEIKFIHCKRKVPKQMQAVSASFTSEKLGNTYRWTYLPHRSRSSGCPR